jgi:hypothetical protein
MSIASLAEAGTVTVLTWGSPPPAAAIWFSRASGTIPRISVRL